MLSNLELATIRAALRFWLEEIVPHGPSAAMPYLDGSWDKTLGEERIKQLIARFDPDALRYVATDRASARIICERLLPQSDLRDLAVDVPNAPVIHSVIAGD